MRAQFRGEAVNPAIFDRSRLTSEYFDKEMV